MILNAGGYHVYYAGQFIAGPIESSGELEAFLKSPAYKKRVRELDEEEEEASRTVVCMSGGGSSSSSSPSLDFSSATNSQYLPL